MCQLEKSKMECLLVLLLACAASAQYYDTFTGKPTSMARVEQMRQLNMLPVCAIEVKPCDPREPRRLSLTCNNLKYPSRGGVYTPFRRMLPSRYGMGGGLRRAKSGAELPNARALRVRLVTDARKSHERNTQLVTHAALLITSDVTSIHDTVNYSALTQTCCQPGGENDPRCMPIRVADDDVYLRYSNIRCLNLTRAITYQTLGCVTKSVPAERVNSSPPMLDLSHVYGTNDEQAMSFRTMEGGRLKEETVEGRRWPPTADPELNVCVLNQAPNETRCHDSASPMTNILFGSNLMFLLYFRQHNLLARRLQALNPCWDDDRIYYTAREINIATANQMLYYEWAPTVLGLKYLVENKVIFPGALHVDDYDPKLEPGVSVEYVTGTRWFHAIQEGRGNMYNQQGKYWGMIPMVDMTLRTGALPINNTIDGLTQGSFRQPCGFGQQTADPDMTHRVQSDLQAASDVIAADIMKGRDIGLPPYNEYRKLCKLPVAKSFEDLYQWMNTEQVETIASMYETVDDVDVMAGIFGERAAPGAMAGPTLRCIMAEQLLAWRRGDRFWYEGVVHPYAHTPDQLRSIRESSLAQLLCENGDTVNAVQPNPFFLPGPGNEITDCVHYKSMNMEPWRDNCEIKKVKPQDWNIKYQDYGWY